MVNMATAFPSKYLKAADLQDRQVRAVMDKVKLEQIADGEGEKPVLYFSKSNLKSEDTQEDVCSKKGLVLNKTNNKTIMAGYGIHSEKWKGKEIILFMALVDFKGDQVEAIRVRVPKPQKAPAQTQPEPEDSENPGVDLEDTY
jgi:hypothetical protein